MKDPDMTTKNPSLTLTTFEDNVAGSAAAAIKETGATKTQSLVMLPLDEINVYKDSDGHSLNARVADKAWNERVAEYADDMKLRGFATDKPISVFVMEEEFEGKKLPVVYVADGHTRLAAALKAAGEGADIKAIPAIFKPTGTLPEDVSAGMIKDNNGTPFSPYEQAVIVAREEARGLDADAIALRVGKTKRYVQDLLVLARAPASVRNAVQKGEVAAREAVKALRADPKKGAEKITSAVEKAKASGKKKATPSTITGKAKGTGKKLPPQPKAKADPEPAPEPQADETGDSYFLRSAAEYAVQHGKPADGIAFLKGFLADEDKRIAELEKWMGQPAGSWKDASLRVADDSDLPL
jgi:ParB-like chromosome segregation protein Spo0J